MAYNLNNDAKIELKYNFTEEEQLWFSSAREMLAVLKTLQQFKLTNQTRKNIYWVTDSEVMSRVLKKGSHRPMLQALVFQVAKLCNELKIRVEPIHIKREDPRIQFADEHSKVKDTDNWSVDFQSFQTLNEQFHFDWDIFPDKLNRKMQKIFSQYFDNKTSGIDAFSKSWNKLG